MKTRPFSIYLLKAGINTADAAVNQHLSIRKTSVGQGPGKIGDLFHKTTPSRPPRWITFFEPHVNQQDFLSSNSSAVFIVRAGGRLFALAFGHGRHLLDPSSYEENFGLRVTLNSVSPDEIRTIERQALDATGRHSREQASRNIPIIEFGLDIDKDILRAVTGPPEDATLGKRLTGADALSVVADIELANLRDCLNRYLTQYRRRTYLKRFPWVDNIREVGDPAQCEELDNELEERIQEEQLDRIWMAIPDLVDWHDVGGFVYSPAKDAGPFDDISFESYLDLFEHPDEVTLDNLHRHRVLCISSETDMPKANWPVYKCIYAEIDKHGETFLLNGGHWYEVASDYVQEVDNAIRRIPTSTTLHLPDYNDQNEEKYNLRVHRTAPATYALMDRRVVRYGGGSSKIEFCDLYTRRREMVHVKRYAGSGTLSHLFAQGTVSASLFLNASQFRAAVNKLLPTSHKLHSTDAQPRASDYEVAYAIASKSTGRLVLPFFSRVTLRSSYTQLRNMGYHVTLTKIQCQ